MRDLFSENRQVINHKPESTKIYYEDSRNMDRVENNSIACIITSPPYFNYKTYGANGIGESVLYDDYIESLSLIFKECLKKLRPDGKLCVNVTNMKSRHSVEKKSFLYPIVADIIKRCIEIGYIFFDEIIWVKGGANAGALKGKPLFGSYPYPPTPKILDSIQETILIFKKPGKPVKMERDIKEASRLSATEWREYTKGVWHIPAEHQKKGHPAVFPIEIPLRLIKMYSFVNDTILDPFLGSGTTLMACLKTQRNGIGYEINKSFASIINKNIHAL